MNQKLPSGWAQTTIGEVTVDGQQRQPLPQEQFAYIDISSIDRDTKQVRHPQHLSGEEAPSRARKVVTTGDVLVSMTRPNLNAVAIIPTELDGQIASTGFDVLRSVDIDPRWLYYLVRTDDFVSAMVNVMKGALYPAVRSRDVRSFEIPLAPLNEQKRIAEKLDALLVRVNACRESLDRLPAILKRFRQAVLKAAMSGQLTEDWEANREDWQACTLGSVIVDIRYGTAKKSTYDISDGAPVLRIPNIKDGRIDPSNLKFGHFNIRELETLSLKAGDLLLVRSNGSLELVGKVAVVDPEFDGFLFAGYLMRLRPDTSIVNPQYLHLYLSSPTVRRYIERTARSTSGVNNINSEEVRAIQIELPELEEQHEIVRRVEVLFAYADRLEARRQTTCTQIERLTPALLVKAFRGELVPQDPNDESASALLERIRIMRASATSATEPQQQKSSARDNNKLTSEKFMLTRKDVQPSHLSAILKVRGALTPQALWSASQLDIDDFYHQLKDEEARALLKEKETRDEAADVPCLLEAV